MSVSKITKSPGAGSIEAPGVSLATLNYGGPEATASATEAYTIAPGLMEMPNNPFTVALGGQVPDDGTVTWSLNDAVQSTLAHDAPYTPSMAGKITAAFTLGGVAYVTVPLHIYMHDMNDPAMSPNHMVDENAVLALVRQNAATVIAVQNGHWTDPATWNTGAVPGAGARVLIPSTREVIYDSTTGLRLHSARVDGLLDFAIDRSTRMLVEHLVETKTGTIRIATRTNRLPLEFTCEVIISNRVYDTSPSAASDLDLASDPRLMGRGVFWMGSGAIYGFHRAPHAKTSANSLPMTGDTSVTLDADPEGWQVGDRILIPGTFFEAINGLAVLQDEYRVITGISNGVVSFTDPLIYDHDQHNPNITDPGIWRLPIINRERNVIFQSEDGANIPVWQRGHTMVMHTNQPDIWDAAFIEMGRTDKQIPAGIINSSGDFEFSPDDDNIATQIGALTAQSNLQSRYSFHIHFPGFDKVKKPTGYYLYIEGAPGWALVHHGGRADFIGCVMHRFAGAGMVSESANELGRWHDCIAVGVESADVDVNNGVKGAEHARGINGDFGTYGVGFFYRGRDMVVTDCIAIGCARAHTFYHRWNTPNTSPPISPLRVNQDSHDLGWLSRDQDAAVDFVHRPITHFDGCEAIGCIGGAHVVKAAPTQFHDLNIQIANFKAWSVRGGIALNYIGGYQVADVDLAAFDGPDNDGRAAIGTGKSVQVSVYGFTARGFDVGVRFAADSVNGVGNSNFSAADPRFMLKDQTFIGGTLPVQYEGTSDGTPVSSVTWLAPGGHTDAAFPTIDETNFVIADWEGTQLSNIQMPLVVTDSVSNGKELPKPWDPAGAIVIGDENDTVIRLREIAREYGYYTYNGEPHIMAPIYFSDRLTARPEKTMRLIRRVNASPSLILGTLTRSAVPITANDFTITVVQGQTVSFNALTESAASGEAGATLTLGDPHMTAFVNTGNALADPTPYEPAHFKPNRGDLTIAQDGEMSYTALPHDQPATDDMFVSIYDGRTRWKTVKITFDITLS